MSNPFNSATIRDHATEAQVTFIQTLIGDRALGELPEAHLDRIHEIDLAIQRATSMNDDRSLGELVNRNLDKALTKGGASTLIGILKELPRKTTAATPEAAELEDGIYHLVSANGLNLQIIKVIHAVNGSGRQYAKVLDIETGVWNYSAGMVKKLTAENKLDLETAKEYGHLYGMCVRCGRTLTDEGSIAAGIGPVCATKF